MAFVWNAAALIHDKLVFVFSQVFSDLADIGHWRQRLPGR
jgi:hypothetical protein